MTRALETWVTQAEYLGMVLNGSAIRAMWTRFADLFKIPDEDCLNLSNGCFTRVKTRIGLCASKHYGKAASASSDTLSVKGLWSVPSQISIFRPMSIKWMILAFSMGDSGPYIVRYQ